MQAVSPDYLRFLSGSHQQKATADAWFGGALKKRGMKISDGSISVSQDSHATLSLTVTDTDGLLSPQVDGALSPFGGEVSVRAGMKRGSILEMVPLGRFVISEPDSTEQWATYLGKGGTRTKVRRGVKVSITGSDRMSLVAEQSFTTRVQPTQPTVLAECRRILQGIAPWKAPVGIADKALSSAAVTYSEDRGQALADLASLLDCVPFADPDGAITLARKTPPLTSVWTVPEAQVVDRGSRKFTRSGMHNGVIASGTAFTGAPLRGLAIEPDGPLRWGGPFGRVPVFIDAPLASNQADIDAAAKAALATERRTRWQEISVRIITNYALQVRDCITVPMQRGPITGIVTGITYPLTPTATMEISMSVDPFSLAAVT